jgi:hypothetical protein
MSNTTQATTIRATFSNMLTGTKAYVVEGIANIKAAQQFASQNSLCLDATEVVSATAFKCTKVAA